MPATTNLLAAPAARAVIPVYLSEFQVEELFGIPVARLRKMRCLRIGPPYVSMPRFVRYRTADIESYLEAHRIEADEKPFVDGRGRPRKDGSPANAANGAARRIAGVSTLRARQTEPEPIGPARWDNPKWAAKKMAQ
jgi:hypothetical protein